MLRQSMFVLCGVVLAMAAAGVVSATSYTITDLGIAASGTTNQIYASIPLSVNDSGQVVGYLAVNTSTNASERRAAYYNSGTWVDFGDGLAPGNGITAGAGKPSWAMCINDSGLVSGFYPPSGLVNGASFTYQIGSGTANFPSNGTGVLNYANYQAIHTLNGGVQSDSGWKKWSSGSGLNNNGVLVGSYVDSSSTEHQFTYNGSTSTDISLPSGMQLATSADNYAIDINDAGVVVAHADIWDGVHGPPPLQGSGYYITTDGVWHSLAITVPTKIAGNYVVGSNSESAFTGSTAQICTLGGSATNVTLSGDLWSLATGVSTGGIAVGVSDTQSTPAASSVQVQVDATQRAFIYSGTSTALLSSVVTGSDPFTSLQDATAISDNGNYIVGYGPVNGVLHGFLLSASATPEPSTLLLAASGLAGLLAYAWRKRK